jgi:membrane associated rhomboid family serine protease
MNEAEIEKKHLIHSLIIPSIFSILIILIHGYVSFYNIDVAKWGVYPRENFGFMGVFTAPFVHSGWEHLFSNLPPFFIASVMIIYFYPKIAYQSILIIYVLTGLLVWIIARQVYHIGASGVVYGLIAFIAWSGIFRRNRRSLALATIIIVLYGGIYATTEPIKEGISWESHLLGAFSGVFTAYFFKEELETEEAMELSSVSKSAEEKTFFFERDTFEMTIEERIAAAEKLRQEEELRKLHELLQKMQSQPPTNFPYFPGQWFSNNTWS